MGGGRQRDADDDEGLQKSDQGDEGRRMNGPVLDPVCTAV